MAQDIIDTSVFARAAELLARPLSPTALEKEAQESKANDAGKPSPPSESSPTPQETSAAIMAKTESPGASASKSKQRQPSKGPQKSARENSASTSNAPQDMEKNLSEHISEGSETAHGKSVVVAGSLLDAVAGLNMLQKDLRGKMNSPSHKRGGPPKIKRPPAKKTLSTEERNEKMGEIDDLEEQLRRAKAVAAAAKEVAAAVSGENDINKDSSDASNAREASTGKPIVNSRLPKMTEDDSVRELRRQSEERVRARRKQEAKERKEREQREEEERQARHAQADAKAKELERLAKERVQERLREERERERKGKEEEEKQRQVREQRAATAAEELHQVAAKRLAEREHSEKQQEEAAAAAEAQARRKLAEENEARASELREKTKLRVQQRARELQAQQQAEEDAQQRRHEEEAEAALERQRQTQLSQQRARARAAEFRQRSRQDSDDRARLEDEQQQREKEQADAALKMRQQKRHWRGGAPPQDQAPGSPSTPSQCSVAAPLPNRVPQKMPPKPPTDRVPVRGGQASAPSLGTAAVRPTAAGGAPRRAQAREEHLEEDDEVQVTVPIQVAHSRNRCPVAKEASNVVQCTVGFFGLGSCEDADDDDDPFSPEPEHGHTPLAVATPQGYAAQAASRRSYRDNSCRTPEHSATPIVNAANVSRIPRAQSQPPPMRPVTSSSSRASSPAPPAEGCSRRSPGGGSAQSDPHPVEKRKMQPWKQKMIQVKSTDYYLDLVKAARGQANAKGVPAKQDGYGDRMRQRASDVEVEQRKEADEREERGYAVLQRVQQRALNAAPSRSASCGP